MPTDNTPDDNNADKLAAEAKAAAEEKVQSIDEQLGNIPKKVSEKIKACENILVALSKDPSVDEISAAIGLTMILNKLGKHVTAIYSGETPNTLEFLNPSETFEKDTNSLQDFIIALSKDKADHLRYKIEGDYVKVYITPYKTTISQNDLEFSQGDFNVDLVISIDVDSAEVLDAALEEYGRIMHDATAINITTNQAGHFAELEWSDPSKSSVCEMIVNLCDYLEIGDFDQPTATALLTGIVSATERFSNARTTSETMQISSKLMQAGADQQLISTNVMQPEAPAEAATEEEKPAEEAPKEEAPAEPETPPEPLIPAPSLAAAPAPEAPAAPTPEQQLEQAVAAPAASTGMPETLATELANATPEPTPAPAPAAEPAPVSEPEVLVGTPAPEAPKPAPSLEPAGPEGLAAPTTVETEPVQSDTFALPGQSSADDVQAAMNEILNPGAAPAAPEAPTTPEAPVEAGLPQIVSQSSVMQQNVSEPLPESPDYGAMIDQALTEAQQTAPANPAIAAAPAVPETPEVPAQPVAVPQDAAPQGAGIELPPPPAPNVDLSEASMPPAVAVSPEPAAPAAVEPASAAAPAPEVPAVPETPVAEPASAAPAPEAPAADPSAFQIPKA